MRHVGNLEGVRTHEGTDEVHILIMSRAITGIPVFSERTRTRGTGATARYCTPAWETPCGCIAALLTIRRRYARRGAAFGLFLEGPGSAG
jgi:hypothetical protein